MDLEVHGGRVIGVAKGAASRRGYTSRGDRRWRVVAHAAAEEGPGRDRVGKGLSWVTRNTGTPHVAQRVRPAEGCFQGAEVSGVISARSSGLRGTVCAARSLRWLF